MSAGQTLQKLIDAVNRHDAAGYAAMFAPNGMIHDPAYAEPLEGRAAIQADVETFMRAFPDLRATVRSLIEQGDTGAADSRFRGTHLGPLELPSGPIPPTGRKVDFSGAAFVRLDGQGRVLEESRYYDLAGLLSQLGVPV
jgi:steroid delta-isomerase-like uncharacterized protein